MSTIILPHGNYQELESYQNSLVIFDATTDFCHFFLKRNDRTTDQMIQAARSGKQNIIEGTMASGISTETELKLIGVARASLEELLEDYRDHLRSRKLQLWEKDDPRILQIRQLAKQKNKSYETYKSYLPANDPELFCNVMISLIHQTNFLLDRQLKSLEAKFVQKGGLRERMTRSRTAYRDRKADFSGELQLLREIYSEIQKSSMTEKDSVLRKIEHLANTLKSKEDIRS